jgi:pyridoxamine 5'-phosphate oxidase
MTNPIALFNRLYRQAFARKEPLPDSVALATADRRGRPSVRYVLLKGADERGFVFYTHQTSRKGAELKANPHAALAFYWDRTGWQVRVEGPVVPVTDAESDLYWNTRPFISRIGAVASDQSRLLPSRARLMLRVLGAAARNLAGRVPRPPRWHGYRLKPVTIEFWSRRIFRLHSRVLYRRTARGWRKRLLYP